MQVQYKRIKIGHMNRWLLIESGLLIELHFLELHYMCNRNVGSKIQTKYDMAPLILKSPHFYKPDLTRFVPTM